MSPKGESGWPLPSPQQYSRQEVGETVSTEFWWRKFMAQGIYALYLKVAER